MQKFLFVCVLLLLFATALSSAAYVPAEVDAGSTYNLFLPRNRVKLMYRAAAASEIVSARWSATAGPYWVGFDSAANVNVTAAFGRPGTYILSLAITFAPASGRAPASLQTTIVVNPSQYVFNASSNALDHVSNSVKPTFRAGHTLPPNSGTIQSALRLSVELADHWGYGLWVGIQPPYCLSIRPENQGSNAEQLIHAAMNSNGKYRLIASIANVLPGHGYPSDRWVADAQASNTIIPDEVWLRNGSGYVLPTPTRPELSPLAPESWIRSVVADHGKCIRNISNMYPISGILSAGEYGVGVGGFNAALRRDPAVLAAAGYAGQTDDFCDLPSSNCSDARYNATLTVLSRGSKRHDWLIRDEISRGVSWKNNQQFYGLYTDSYGFDRARWNGWKSWMFQYEHGLQLGGISTKQNPQIYWNDANSGFTGINSLFAPNDALSKFLNEIGGGIRFGTNLTYPWISNGGYPLAGNIVADRTRFMGLLKSIFTAGAVGGVAGWFNYTGDVYARQSVSLFPTGPALPDWVWLFQDIGWVQSLFSHLEPFLRDGYLLHSNKIHPYNYDPVDSPANPWYALDVFGEPWNAEWNKGVGPSSFVLVRKLRSSSLWLISAWANVGSSRNVTFLLPGPNRNVTVWARTSGAIYIATLTGGQISTRLVDIDSMNPSMFLFEDSALQLLGSEAQYPTSAPPVFLGSDPDVPIAAPARQGGGPSQTAQTSGASRLSYFLSVLFVLAISCML